MNRIIVNEYPKAGGTWLVSLIGTALSLPMRDIYIDQGFNVFDARRHFWYENADDLGLPDDCVIKSHELPSSALLSFPAKHIHLVRDGRDVVVSKYFYENEFLIRNGMSDTFAAPLDDYTIQTAAEWRDFVEAWLETAVPYYRYEDLLRDTEGTLRRIFDDLSLACDDAAIREAVRANTKDRMQQQFAKAFAHNTFVRKGIAGDYRRVLNAYPLDGFMQAAGNTLRRLGYEEFPNYLGAEAPEIREGSQYRCWCGNYAHFLEFSEQYVICAVCHTVVDKHPPSARDLKVTRDDTGFYGRDYWFSHQRAEFGFPDLYERARRDLPERCTYWLKTLLRYRHPPRKVLELGSAHGAFVGLLKQAGYDPVGLDMSPSIVEFAASTFDVPMLLGTIEEQAIEPESFDVIVLMDVMEHLPNPAETLAACVRALKPNGILLIQTPEYRELTYQELTEASDGFLSMLLPTEHIHLFSKRAVRLLFSRLGLTHIRFEKALFSYDMFFVVAKSPDGFQMPDAPPVLNATPAARLVQALLDKYGESEQLQAEVTRYQQGNAQLELRANAFAQTSQKRQEAIEQQQQTIDHLQTGSSNQLAYIEQQQQAIEQLEQQLRALQQTSDQRQSAIEQQQQAIEQLQLGSSRQHAYIEHQQHTIERLQKEIEALTAQLQGTHPPPEG